VALIVDFLMISARGSRLESYLMLIVSSSDGNGQGNEPVGVTSLLIAVPLVCGCVNLRRFGVRPKRRHFSYLLALSQDLQDAIRKYEIDLNF
jgi:hypothetical protein